MPMIPIYLKNGANSGSIARTGRGRGGYLQVMIRGFRSIVLMLWGA